MIEPIKQTDILWHESYANYGVTKFIDSNGDGCRGVIIENNGEWAKVYVLNGDKAGQIVEIFEVNPEQHPEVRK